MATPMGLATSLGSGHANGKAQRWVLSARVGRPAHVGTVLPLPGKVRRIVGAPQDLAQARDPVH
eukprot:16436171-Heterocapsa_arctica.AAC.1